MRRSRQKNHSDAINRSLTNRSRITNGTELLPYVDGRSTWVRRLRDLMDLHIDDAGGHDNTSEAQRSLIRRVSVLETELEFQETRLAEMRLSGQEPTEKQLDLYNRLAGNLRRLLESIGIERKARKVPSLHDVLSKSR